MARIQKKKDLGMVTLNCVIFFLLATHFCPTAGSRLLLHHNLTELSERSVVKKSGFGSKDVVEPMFPKGLLNPPGNDPVHNNANPPPGTHHANPPGNGPHHNRGDDASSKP